MIAVPTNFFFKVSISIILIPKPDRLHHKKKNYKSCSCLLNTDTKTLNYKTSRRNHRKKVSDNSKRCHYKPNKITKIEKTNTSASEEAKQLEPTSTADGNAKWDKHFGK